MSANVERSKDTLQTIIERQAAELVDLRAQQRRLLANLRRADQARQQLLEDNKALRALLESRGSPPQVQQVRRSRACPRCGRNVQGL